MGSPRNTTRRIRRPKTVTQERWVAWSVLVRCQDDGAWADRVLAELSERFELEQRERGQAQQSAYGVLESQRALDFCIAKLGKRPTRKLDTEVLCALRLGAYQLLMLDGIADHAAVDQSVEIVRAACGERPVAFTNAVLRRIQVDGPKLIEEIQSGSHGAAVQLSMPDWITKSMERWYGEDGLQALAAQNQPLLRADNGEVITPVRVLTGHDESLGEIAVELGKAGCKVVDLPEPWNSIVAGWAVGIAGSTTHISPLVTGGRAYPQSLSSMLVVKVLDPTVGERVLDLCAAPGGKTSLMAALVGSTGQVTAFDLHEHRTDAVKRTCEIQGVGGWVRALTRDATKLAVTDLIDGEPLGTFSKVLLDAPCSGLGVLSQRPDSRYHRTEESCAELVALQRELLAAAVSLTASGGIITYSTCTLNPSENEDNIAWACENLDVSPAPFTPALVEALPASMLRAPHEIQVWPHKHHSDGFYVAQLRRN